MPALDYLTTFRRYWRTLVAATLLGGVAAGLFAVATTREPANNYSASIDALVLTPQARIMAEELLTQASLYSATSEILVTQDESQTSLVPTLVRLANSERLISAVAVRMETTLDLTRDQLNVSADDNSEILLISSFSSDAKNAVSALNSFEEELQKQINELYPNRKIKLISIESNVKEPLLSNEDSSLGDGRNAGQIALELIAQDQSAAEKNLSTILSLVNQEDFANLADELSLVSDSARGAGTFSISATAGTPDPVTGVSASASAISLVVNQNDPTAARLLAQGMTKLLQDRSVQGSDDSPGTLSPVVVTSEVESGPVTPPENNEWTFGGVFLGLFVGLASGVGMVLFRVSKDDVIHRPTQFFAVAGDPPIGIICSKPEEQVQTEMVSFIDESASDGYLNLRSRVLYGLSDSRVLCITPADKGEGGMSVAANLSVSLISAGKSVLLLETDFRDSHLAGFVGQIDQPGVLEVLGGTSTLEAAIKSWNAGPKVLVAGSGQDGERELIFTAEYAHLIANLREQFDYVICLAGPILSSPESAAVAEMSDGVLLVAQVGTTTISHLVAAAVSLNHVQAQLKGIIITNVPEEAAPAWTVIPTSMLTTS